MLSPFKPLRREDPPFGEPLPHTAAWLHFFID